MKKMVLLPTGSDRLLEIRTAYVDMVVKSKVRRIPNTEEAVSGASSLKVMGMDLEQVSVPVQGVSETYISHEGLSIHEYNISPLFFEQTDYVVTIHAKNGESLIFRSNSSLIERRISPVIDDDPSLLSGVVNFGSNVGFSDLIVLGNNSQILFVRVEVYPTKISYKEDYQKMMADINYMVSESILDFMRRTYQVFVPNHKRNDVPAVFFTIIQTIFKKYIQALNRVILYPHHKLISEHKVVPHYKVVRTDLKSERWLQKYPEYVRYEDNEFFIERILAVKKRTTYDTQENRLVKFMLKSMIRRIDDFVSRYEKGIQQPDEIIIDGAVRMTRELQRFLSTTFLADVSDYNFTKSMSLVFGMAPGYRELYKYYLMMQNGISVGGDIFHMSVRDTAQLYEYWCFIKLYDILRSHYTLKSPDIIQVDRRGVTINLAKGQPSKVTFLNTKTGEQIFLSYNPKESKTQTVNQRPDNVLELEKKGSKSTYKYIFDAKYRIETNPDGQFYPDTKPGPKIDDINTMHRYRDSIVYENTESRFTFEKTMFGAYILFPYNNEEEYKEHHFYKSIESVNIGGLPFLPSSTALVTDLLNELVSDSSDSAFERTSLPTGIEERLKSVEWDRREVLIGLVPDQNHYNIFFNNRIYFTQRFDSVNLPIRYVALYEKGTGIKWYGEVISWLKEPRHTLPGHSNHGMELYHVFKVLKWIPLQSSITKSEYGPNPIAYTNFFLLSNSSTYSELLLKSEADYRFFSELKRRTEEAIIEGRDESTAFKIGDAKVMFRNTGIYACVDDKPVKMCSVQEFSKHPNAMFKRIQMYVETIQRRFES